MLHDLWLSFLFTKDFLYFRKFSSKELARKKVSSYACEFAGLTQEGIIATKWADHKDVYCLSNCNNADIKAGERKQKDGSYKPVLIPTMIQDYNMCMIGMLKIEIFSLCLHTLHIFCLF